MRLFGKISAMFMLALTTAQLTGCAGGPSPDAAALASAPLPKSHARLKIHRESNILGMAADARIAIDGKEVASLSNGETRVLTIPAGTHQVAVDHWAHPGTSTLELNAKPGALYELAVEVRGDAAAAGLAFGFVGAAAESAASNNSGYWSIRLAKQEPAA